MRKLVLTLMTILLIFGMTFPANAGDIPESLLHDENAQLFFGEVLAYHPNKENPDIEVSPVAGIKGDVKEGTKQIYYGPNPVGDFRIWEGKTYLFAYVKGNDYIEIFDVTTYDTRTLKLKHAEGDMWKRFEEYINDGEYGEAGIDRSFHASAVLPWIAGSVISLTLIVFGSVFLYRKMK